MKTLLRPEETAILLLSIVLYHTQLHFSGWLYFTLFLLADLGMAGYLINSRAGALTYNVFHHKGITIRLYPIGLATASKLLQLSGLVPLGIRP